MAPASSASIYIVIIEFRGQWGESLLAAALQEFAGWRQIPRSVETLAAPLDWDESRANGGLFQKGVEQFALVKGDGAVLVAFKVTAACGFLDCGFGYSSLTYSFTV